jgi:hypothetical protein
MNPATAEKMAPPRAGALEVLLTLTPSQYAEMGNDLEALRRRLKLPKSASNTRVILEALHRFAKQG